MARTTSRKKEKPSKQKFSRDNKKLMDIQENLHFDWQEEFFRLCQLVQRILHQLEQDLLLLETSDTSAAAKKSARVERNGILSSVAKLVQLFSELISVQQHIQKFSDHEEEVAVITEMDLEIIEQYFKKCREIGIPLLGKPDGQS